MRFFQYFFLMIACCGLGLLALPSCRKSSNSVHDEDDTAKVCQNILKAAETETYPLVQPPALARFPLEGVDTSVLPLPADSHFVLGMNLVAFTKSGFLDLAARQFPNVSMAKNVLTFLGLAPGRAAQVLLVGARFGKSSWIPENLTIAILGTFSSKEIIHRVSGITSLKTWLPQIDLPPVTRDGDTLMVIFGEMRWWLIPYKNNILLITNRKDTRTDLASNVDFTNMTAPIARDTALWFTMVETPHELPSTTKVLERLFLQLKRFTGYLNMDEKLNLEFQMRYQFGHHQAARQAKEILRLGVSQILLRMGPRIQKSFLLEGTSDHESVVSRGSFVRFLFRLDSFQVQYLLQWMASTLRATGY